MKDQSNTRLCKLVVNLSVLIYKNKDLWEKSMHHPSLTTISNVYNACFDEWEQVVIKGYIEERLSLDRLRQKQNKKYVQQNKKYVQQNASKKQLTSME